MLRNQLNLERKELTSYL